MTRSAALLRGLLQRLERLSAYSTVLQQHSAVVALGQDSTWRPTCGCCISTSSSACDTFGHSSLWRCEAAKHVTQPSSLRGRQRQQTTQSTQRDSSPGALRRRSTAPAFAPKHAAALRALSTGPGPVASSSRAGTAASAELHSENGDPFIKPGAKQLGPVRNNGGGMSCVIPRPGSFEGEVTDADVPLELMSVSDFLAYPMHKRKERRKAELTFQVIDFFPDGHAVEVMKPRTASELDLHPRELGLFAPLSRLAAPQRATIAVRGRKILFKTEVAKAIISADKAILIKGSREHAALRLSRDLITAAEDTASPLPFELRMLDALLSSTAEYFIKKTQHLNWMMESIGDEIRQPGRPFMAMDKAHQLIPIQKFLTAVKNDVRETCEAIVHVMEDDLPDLCLTYKRMVQLQGSALMHQDSPSIDGASLPSTSSSSSGSGVGSIDGMQREFSEDIEIFDESRLAADSLGSGGGQEGAGFGAVEQQTGALEVILQQSQSAGFLQQLQQRQQELQQEAQRRRQQQEQQRQEEQQREGRLQMKMAEEMLETYEREFRSLEGSLKETEENLDNTRQLWHMQLDSSRNYIMLASLWISMASISVMTTTLLPAFFGMNLNSGFSDNDPSHFYAVVGGSIILAAISFPMARELYYRNWRRQAHQELFEQKMLRVLLVQHVDDLDDIIHALNNVQGRIDRHAFRDLVNKTLGSHAMSQNNVDFLYHIFDTNKDGFLSEAELMKRMGINYSRRNSSDTSDEEGFVDSSGTCAAGLADDLDHWRVKVRRTPANGNVEVISEEGADSELFHGSADERDKQEGDKQERQQSRPRHSVHQEIHWDEDEKLRWD